MGFDGPSIGRILGAGFSMLKGAKPFQMQPLDPDTLAAVGDPVDFVHDDEEHEFEVTAGGGIDQATLCVYTATGTYVGAIFRQGGRVRPDVDVLGEGGRVWYVAKFDPDGQAGEAWPFYVEMTGRAVGGKEGGVA